MKRKFDYNFKVQNLAKSKKTHLKRIKKLKDAGITYDEVIGPYADQNIEIEILQSKYWYYNLKDLIKDNLKKYEFNSIKQLVNSATRDHIKRGLEYHGIPKSYDTSFYLNNYKRINLLMKKVLKSLIRQLDK